QIDYNTKNGFTPMAIKKSLDNALTRKETYKIEAEELVNLAAEDAEEYLTKPQIEKKIRSTRKAMEAAAKELDFMQAAKLRDQIKVYQEQIKELA
ncbi:excinuclease ABC subunit B, partial [Tenacibaculum discolor]